VGAALIGVLALGEPANASRLLAIGLIAVGIVTLAAVGQAG
jgi:multidrug transporter EmrE-like cation transporter